MGTNAPHGITQCYWPPVWGDIPAFTPAEAATQFSDPGGTQGRLHSERYICPKMVTYPTMQIAFMSKINDDNNDKYQQLLPHSLRQCVCHDEKTA